MPTDPPDPLGPLARAAHFHQVRQTRVLLKQGGEGALRQALAAAHERAVSFLVDAQKLAPPPGPSACKEGCAWCCHLRVTATPLEILRIAEYLREVLSANQLASFHAHLCGTENQTHGQSDLERAQSKVPCALLENHRCRVYAVRPLRCRGCNSLDANRCEAEYEAPGSVNGIPAYTVQLGIMSLLDQALGDGTRHAGLDATPCELHAGLRIALELPEAAKRWLAGERIFANGCGGHG